MYSSFDRAARLSLAAEPLSDWPESRRLSAMCSGKAAEGYARSHRHKFARTLFFLSSKLQFIKACIQTAVHQQLFMSSLFHHASFINDEDHVGAADGS